MKYLAAFAACMGAAGPDDLPEAWRSEWQNPPAEMRPLPILHGVPADRATPQGMAALKDAGMGGIVCNVAFQDYLKSEAHWATLVKAVESCRQLGMVVWIYDEDGYPSAAAGGRVLERNRAFEAQVLAFDRNRPDPFFLRPAYEFTHASNNYYASRRCPNLLEAEAVKSFIDLTHGEYRRRLGGHFGTTVKAFFTDEPSLMAVHLGQLPESVRKTVRVADPVDEKAVILPTVPWCADLPEQYRKRYKEDLLAVRRNLFEGMSEADRAVRRRFWALVTDLVAERYFGQIQDWCRANKVASSGHGLWEENVLHHVPLYGNLLQSLLRMDVPGLDLLTSDPMAAVGDGWVTAGLPASAAVFNGGRRVMTEVSDFAQTMAGKGAASLEMMQATAAWQAALGVTEFTSYYGTLGQILKDPPPPGAEVGPAYGRYVGRLNAILREARLEPEVLLYYPIHDLWAEYLPVADRLSLENQSPRARQIVRSFLGTGRKLTTAQVSLAVADHELLAKAEVRDGAAWLVGRRFGALVLPAGVELPGPAAAAARKLQEAGGIVMQDGDAARPLELARLAAASPTGHLDPASGTVIVGRFRREGRRILAVVNVGTQPYAGRLRVEEGAWRAADPATGEVSPRKAGADGRLEVSLPGRSATLLIGP
jgi:hypothetical protein